MKTYQVLLNNHEKRVVRGHVHPSGLFGFHKEDRKWEVDHIPTGYGLCGFSLLSTAKKAIDDLLIRIGSQLDWQQESKDYWIEKKLLVYDTVRPFLLERGGW